MKKIYNSIKKGAIAALEKRVFSEADLFELSQYFKKDKNLESVILYLVSNIPKMRRNFDWNLGSILQHLSPLLVINALDSVSHDKLYNSIGLAWVFGEFGYTDRRVTDFLYGIVKNATSPDAWWRAAFSLEKLGLEDAVNFLKMSIKTDKLRHLNYYLKNLNNKRSVISILVLSNVENIENEIYPSIKAIVLTTKNDSVKINCCWLIGRLKLIDHDIYKKLLSFIAHDNYELRYYTFFALQNNATEKLRQVMEGALGDKDPLIRKMAVRAVLSIGNEQSLSILRERMFYEKEESVISELSEAIYGLINPLDRSRLSLESHAYRNENGMIADESDKWYRDPAIYHAFSEAEDPENICFELIRKRVDGLKIHNPVDLATGTGRMIWQIIDKMPFDGEIFGIDISEQMCEFIRRAIKRERKFTGNVCLKKSTIANAHNIFNKKSSFIISSFGFPSRISDRSLCLHELISVEKMLAKDGLFFTIGWDETFNDELSQMWYRYIPDKIQAKDFEDWRRRRAEIILSPRNCKLTWFKKGIAVPLQFHSIKEAASVMGYLFGRDAARYIVKSGKIEWQMSLGITCNTKQEIRNIIKSYERN